MSLVFGYELEVISDFAQEHFWYFDPVGAAGRAEQSLQLCATFVERDSLVDFLKVGVMNFSFYGKILYSERKKSQKQQFDLVFS